MVKAKIADAVMPGSKAAATPSRILLRGDCSPEVHAAYSSSAGYAGKDSRSDQHREWQAPRVVWGPAPTRSGCRTRPMRMMTTAMGTPAAERKGPSSARGRRNAPLPRKLKRDSVAGQESDQDRLQRSDRDDDRIEQRCATPGISPERIAASRGRTAARPNWGSWTSVGDESA